MHAIAAEVHHRTAAERRVVANLSGLRGNSYVEMSLEFPKCADPVRRNKLQQACEERVKSIVIRLDQKFAVALSRVDHRLRFPGVHRKRLFAQHVLARIQCGDRPVCVAARRQAVVDEIDLVARHEGSVIRIDLRYSVFLRKHACS
jgi:hypothetical protein